MHSTRAFLSSAVGILLLVGLTALPGLLVSPPASAQDVLHEVHAGDDLRLIAGYYYGDTRQWEKIWRANRDGTLSTDDLPVRAGTDLQAEPSKPADRSVPDKDPRPRRIDPVRPSPRN